MIVKDMNRSFTDEIVYVSSPAYVGKAQLITAGNESLAAVAGRFHTTAETLISINRITADCDIAGALLLVPFAG